MRFPSLHVGGYLVIFFLGEHSLRYQFPRTRIGTVLNHAIALRPAQPSSDQLFPRGTVQVHARTVPAQPVPYALGNGLCVPLQFGCRLGSFLSQLVGVLIVIVCSAPNQGQNAAKNNTERSSRAP